MLLLLMLTLKVENLNREGGVGWVDGGGGGGAGLGATPMYHDPIGMCCG